MWCHLLFFCLNINQIVSIFNRKLEQSEFLINCNNADDFVFFYLASNCVKVLSFKTKEHLNVLLVRDYHLICLVDVIWFTEYTTAHFDSSTNISLER